MSEPAASFPEFDSPRIFPAIDLRGGRCVRLIRGRKEAEIHYDDDPLRIAFRWRDVGAECLHVIDLGAAFGEPDSTARVLEIARETGLPLQVGGGLRDEEKVERLLAGGVGRVILGTRAFGDPEFALSMVETHGANRVVIGLDCDGERVKVSGWEEESSLDVTGGLEVAARAGVRHLLVTAIDRDGTLSGARDDLVRRVLEAGDFKVVAAGGIGRLDHIRSLLEIDHPRLEGIVVGRALYEGTVDLREALELAADHGERKKAERRKAERGKT